MKREYLPITVLYKKKSGSKVWAKTFTDLPCPDKLLSPRTTLLPKDCEIVHIGVGKSYIIEAEKKPQTPKRKPRAKTTSSSPKKKNIISRLSSFLYE